MATHIYSITIPNSNFTLTDGCIIYTMFGTTIDSTSIPVFNINGSETLYRLSYLTLDHLLPGYTIDQDNIIQFLYVGNKLYVIGGVTEPKLKYGFFTTSSASDTSPKILTAISGFTDISQLASGESMIAYVNFLNGNTADQYTFQFPNVTKTILLTKYAYTSKQYSGYIDPTQTVSFLISNLGSDGYEISVIGGAHNFKTTKYSNYSAKISAISQKPKPN